MTRLCSLLALTSNHATESPPPGSRLNLGKVGRILRA
jgi:hypothetical protein